MSAVPVLLAVVSVLAAATVAPAQPPPGFKLHAKFSGIGGCLAQLIGPGPEPGSQRLYASHIYGGDTLDGLGGVVYNGVAPGPRGQLYGLSAAGIFTVDEAARGATVVARYPGPISAGFALRGQELSFTSGPRIVSYALP